MAREIKGFRDGQYYTVIDKQYGHRAIDVLPSEQESVEGCRKAIDRVNNWRRSDANIWDVKPEQFYIAIGIWNKSYYADGTFCESNEKVKVLEVYPEQI